MESEEHRDTDLLSKTQRKKEATALQKLGEQLTGFTSAQLHHLPLSEKLIAALIEFDRLPNSRGARKRQLQFIGRLMRDSDFDAVTNAITQLQSDRHKPDIKQDEAGDWCQKIIAGGDDQINELLKDHPQLERQRLRQLYREYSRANESQLQKTKSRIRSYLQQSLN